MVEEVVVCEARPLCEGVAFARALAAAGTAGLGVGLGRVGLGVVWWVS